MSFNVYIFLNNGLPFWKTVHCFAPAKRKAFFNFLLQFRLFKWCFDFKNWLNLYFSSKWQQFSAWNQQQDFIF